MFQVAGLVLPLFGLVFLGYLSGRLKKIPLEGLAWLNFFILYIALPALFFRLLATTPVSEFANGRFLFNTTLSTFLIFALCFLVGRVLRKSDTRTATVQGFAGAYGNIGYMGPPLAIAAFGPQAGVPVALVFCLDNAMHFTLAPTLMALGDSRRQAFGKLIIGIIVKIISHPFILATIAGIGAAWFEFRPPAAIDQLLANAASAAAPCALFAMGVTAALRPLKRIPVELGYLIPVKLLLHPLLVYLLLSRLPGLDPVWLHAAVLLAALPSATNVFVIAQQYSVWEERASSAVVLSTLLSVVTVTAYLYLVKAGLI
ncbi:AEC family transporter [Granulosicoccus sp. 3-233]|uniref:AEC family transporter n=1 Tax=Granulosicoccus sp. 3-233 TaxID=3417969 RepID=UPI003D336397